jgi:cell division GTPase FtsZ
MTSLFMHWFVLSGRFHLPSLTIWLFQVNAAAEIIYDLVDPNANLIFGAVIDPSLSGQVSLSLFCYI